MLSTTAAPAPAILSTQTLTIEENATEALAAAIGIIDRQMLILGELPGELPPEAQQQLERLCNIAGLYAPAAALARATAEATTR